MTESDKIKSTASWLSIVSGLAFAAGLFLGAYSFVSEGKESVYAMEIAGVCLAVSFWSLFWAQFAHIRSGIERTNELLAIISDGQAASIPSHPQPSKTPTQKLASNIEPPTKEHTEWLLACAKADREGFPRPDKPG